MEEIRWKTVRRKLSELKHYKENPRMLTCDDRSRLKESIGRFGLVEIPAINADNTIIAGHQRVTLLENQYGNEYEIDVRAPSRILTQDEFKEYLIRSNKNTGSWDHEILECSFDANDLIDWGFSDNDLDFSAIEDLDIEEVEEFSEEVSFVIKCRNLDELSILHKKLNTSGKKISLDKFLEAIDV